MRVLAFDTATARTAVALRDLEAGDNVCLRAVVDLASVDDPPPGTRPGHVRLLLELVHQLLERSGGGWDEVDRIAAGIGPGSFTGLRIGIATAKALSASSGVPLLGVSTLRALAVPAHGRGNATLAVIDARRGEAFVAGWTALQDPLTDVPTLAPQVLAPEQLAAAAAALGVACSVIGDGALRFRDVFVHGGAQIPSDESPLHRVSAREHCRIAALQPPAPSGSIEPAYLRPADAEAPRP